MQVSLVAERHRGRWRPTRTLLLLPLFWSVVVAQLPGEKKRRDERSCIHYFVGTRAACVGVSCAPSSFSLLGLAPRVALFLHAFIYGEMYILYTFWRVGEEEGER